METVLVPRGVSEGVEEGVRIDEGGEAEVACCLLMEA